jgi:hypothetical protein
METEKPISQLEPPPDEAVLTPEPPRYRGLRGAFMGDQGLRAGWSVAIFILLSLLFLRTLALVASAIFGNHHLASTDSFSPFRAIVGEVVQALAFLCAGALVALIERRRVVDYNLTGPRRFVQRKAAFAASCNSPLPAGSTSGGHWALSASSVWICY